MFAYKSLQIHTNADKFVIKMLCKTYKKDKKDGLSCFGVLVVFHLSRNYCLTATKILDTKGNIYLLSILIVKSLYTLNGKKIRGTLSQSKLQDLYL